MTDRVEENSGFQLVSSKKRLKSKQLKGKYDPLDYNLRRIESVKEELGSSDYYLQLINLISKSLNLSSANSTTQA
ncbi:hypothetical protein M8J76_007884 [Diaphorina citri]|nr:hypothetical protein M8J75_013305 [Diaphorina citri]KAI5740855.1 hypothetical protein M8J76_007884 [Diaphorina citri]